jgi:hypothetical protein
MIYAQAGLESPPGTKAVAWKRKSFEKRGRAVALLRRRHPVLKKAEGDWAAVWLFRHRTKSHNRTLKERRKKIKHPRDWAEMVAARKVKRFHRLHDELEQAGGSIEQIEEAILAKAQHQGEPDYDSESGGSRAGSRSPAESEAGEEPSYEQFYDVEEAGPKDQEPHSHSDRDQEEQRSFSTLRLEPGSDAARSDTRPVRSRGPSDQHSVEEVSKPSAPSLAVQRALKIARLAAGKYAHHNVSSKPATVGTKLQPSPLSDSGGYTPPPEQRVLEQQRTKTPMDLQRAPMTARRASENPPARQAAANQPTIGTKRQPSALSDSGGYTPPPKQQRVLEQPSAQTPNVGVSGNMTSKHKSNQGSIEGRQNMGAPSKISSVPKGPVITPKTPTRLPPPRGRSAAGTIHSEDDELPPPQAVLQSLKHKSNHGITDGRRTTVAPTKHSILPKASAIFSKEPSRPPAPRGRSATNMRSEEYEHPPQQTVFTSSSSTRPVTREPPDNARPYARRPAGFQKYQGNHEGIPLSRAGLKTTAGTTARRLPEATAPDDDVILARVAPDPAPERSQSRQPAPKGIKQEPGTNIDRSGIKPVEKASYPSRNVRDSGGKQMRIPSAQEMPPPSKELQSTTHRSVAQRHSADIPSGTVLDKGNERRPQASTPTRIAVKQTVQTTEDGARSGASLQHGDRVQRPEKSNTDSRARPSHHDRPHRGVSENQSSVRKPREMENVRHSIDRRNPQKQLKPESSAIKAVTARDTSPAIPLITDGDGFHEDGRDDDGYDRIGFDANGVNRAGQFASNFPPQFLQELWTAADYHQEVGQPWVPPLIIDEDVTRMQYPEWYEVHHEIWPAETQNSLANSPDNPQQGSAVGVPNKERMDAWIAKLPTVLWRNRKWVGPGPPPPEGYPNPWRPIKREPTDSDHEISGSRASRSASKASARSLATRQSVQRELTAILSSASRIKKKF